MTDDRVARVGTLRPRAVALSSKAHFAALHMSAFDAVDGFSTGT
jgi:hypothetical protein